MKQIQVQKPVVKVAPPPPLDLRTPRGRLLPY
jgi:hypothetical protein